MFFFFIINFKQKKIMNIFEFLKNSIFLLQKDKKDLKIVGSISTTFLNYSYLVLKDSEDKLYRSVIKK